MIDQGIFSQVIILLILITSLLTVYGYCWEKIDLSHYWDLKGLKVALESSSPLSSRNNLLLLQIQPDYMADRLVQKTLL